MEDTPTENGTFALPGKKKFKRKLDSIRYVVVDVTESPINRPKGLERVLFGEKASHAKDAGHH
jgi:hypothetical protein